MRRALRSLNVSAFGAGLLLVATACDTSLPVPLPDFRAKVVEAVRTRLDATGARLEAHKVRDLYEVKVWTRDPVSGKERMSAICWFDERRQLTMVRYAD